MGAEKGLLTIGMCLMVGTLLRTVWDGQKQCAEMQHLKLGMLGGTMIGTLCGVAGAGPLLMSRWNTESLRKIHVGWIGQHLTVASMSLSSNRTAGSLRTSCCDQPHHLCLVLRE